MKQLLFLLFLFLSLASFTQRVSSTHYYYFKSSSEKLNKYEEKKLQLLCDTLFKQKVIYVQITGHTDDSGDEHTNMKLSEERAKNIKASMILYGVPEEKISLLFMGENNPAETNETEKGKAANRRAEVNVVWEE